MGECVSKNVDSADESSKRGKLSESQWEMLEKKTGMTRKDISEWYEKFKCAYPKGEIDEREFRKIFRQANVKGSVDKYARLAFKAFDLDNNAKVTFDEFLIISSFMMDENKSRDNASRAIDFAFDVFDYDKNGKITREETARAIEAIYELAGQSADTSKPKLDEIFQQFDSDQNGWLDKHELASFILADPICRDLFIGTNREDVDSIDES